MKKLLTVLGVIAISSLVLAAPILVPITLAWTPSPNADVYELRGSNDLSGSWSNWPILVTITDRTVSNISLSMTPGQSFFTLVSSNFWGYAISNITNTPTTVVNVTNLTIKR